MKLINTILAALIFVLFTDLFISTIYNSNFFNEIELHLSGYALLYIIEFVLAVISAMVSYTMMVYPVGYIINILFPSDNKSKFMKNSISEFYPGDLEAYSYITGNQAIYSKVQEIRKEEKVAANFTVLIFSFGFILLANVLLKASVFELSMKIPQMSLLAIYLIYPLVFILTAGICFYKQDNERIQSIKISGLDMKTINRIKSISSIQIIDDIEKVA